MTVCIGKIKTALDVMFYKLLIYKGKIIALDCVGLLEIRVSVLDMVGVASSNLVAPTKFGRKIKHLAETPSAFFFRPYAQIERISVTFPPLACTLRSTQCACWPEQLVFKACPRL